MKSIKKVFNWREFSADKLFIIVILIFILLSINYNLSLPVGESDHETSHYRYILYIKEHWQRPPADYVWPQKSEPLCSSSKISEASEEWQFTQPPLYYFLTAAVFSWYDNNEIWWPDNNPYTTLAGLKPGGGLNGLIHTEDETISVHTTVAEVHLYRLFSMLLGVLGLWGVFLIGKLIFSKDKVKAALLSAGVAFVPMYIHASSVISNDILTGVLGIWSLYFFIRSLMSQNHILWHLMGLLFLALGILTKMTAIILSLALLVILLIGAIDAFWVSKNQSRKRFILLVILDSLLIIFSLVWFFSGKAHLSASQRYIFLQQPLDVLFRYPALLSNTLRPHLVDNLLFSFNSYWGLLGVDSIELPTWMLYPLYGFSMIAFIGVLVLLYKSDTSRRDKVAIIASIFILALGWNAIFMATKYGVRGRYILFFYPLISLLFINGTHLFYHKKSGLRLSFVYVGMLFLFAMLVPSFVLKPQFSPPAQYTKSESIHSGDPVNAQYGDFATLMSISIEPEVVEPGDVLTITLVWHVRKSIEENYTIGVYLEDGYHQYLAGIAHYPVNGRYPTSFWKPGDIFEDRYQIYVPKDAPNGYPTGGYIRVTMHCPSPTGDQYVPITDAQGNAIGKVVYSLPFRIGNLPEVSEINSQAFLGIFNDEIALSDIQNLPERIDSNMVIPLSVTWVPLKSPADDYTIFVQVLNSKNDVASSFDVPVTYGYYPTHLWLPYEQLVYDYNISIPYLPPDDYKLIMGLYNAKNQQRLHLVTDSEHFVLDSYRLSSWRHAKGYQNRDMNSHHLNFYPLILHD